MKLGVLVMFAVIAFTGFDADRFAEFAPFGVAGISAAAGTIFDVRAVHSRDPQPWC
jgi:APA family basic amino acid/polyamine antiporter